MQFELHVDPNATIDINLSCHALPTGALPGDLVAIRPLTTRNGKRNDRPLLYKVPPRGADDDDDLVKGRRAGAQVIVTPNVALSFPWAKRRTQVVLDLVFAPPPPHLTASHIELYFSNVYLGRPDMMRLSLSLASTVLYLNQRVTPTGSLARLRVGGIYNQEGKTVRSAWVDENTKFIFRSESARCYVFVEVSQEMWHFEEDGSMLREKCETFLTELFAHWTGGGTEGVDSKSQGQATSHTVSIILYGRVIYEDNGEGEEKRAPLRRDEDGVLYRDFYKVILDLTPSPPSSIVRTVSSEIRGWQEDVLLRLLPNGEQKLGGRIAFAHESNVLEAANLALNSFEEHWIDRDLQRTGLSIIVLTAGSSFYQVPKSLLRLTTERMLCHGLGLDLISLSKTPLHTVPLFSFRSHEPGLSEEYLPDRRESDSSSLADLSRSTTSDPLRKDPSRQPTALPDDQRDPLYYDSPRPSQETSVYYAEPLFVFCSFFGSQIDKPHRLDRFMPRARCYELFSQGIGDRIPIAIPLLATAAVDEEGWTYLSEKEKRQARRDRYDASAVGARSGVDEWAGWTRRSGATSGVDSTGNMSGTSLSRMAHKEAQSEVKSVVEVPRLVTEGRGRVGRAAELEGDREDRGRSITPMGRPPRSSSVAASIRTISSSISKIEARPTLTKALATPALIARLKAPATTSVAATFTTKPSWLDLFRSGQPTTATTPAPLVAVQRVDVQADHHLEFDSDQVSNYPSSRATSPASSIRRAPSSASSKPTQPISISSRTAQTREADRPTTTNIIASTSLSLKKYAPVYDYNDIKHKPLESKFNPSKPGKRSVGLADQARRWASIFLRHTNDQRAVNWVSITRGACLPLTTDYLPTADALSSQYSDYRYSLPLRTTSSSFLLRTDNPKRSLALELVTELISQRLAQGFQICTPANALGALDEINVASSKTVLDVLRDIDDGDLTAIYLSLANQIHRISYDRRTQSIIVKILRRRRTWLKKDHKYGALIWTHGSKSYEYGTLSFPYPNLIDPFDWQHLDRLVAGIEQPDLRPSLRYWRTRLVLLPAESIPDREYIVSQTKAFEGEATDQDINLQGFLTLMEIIQGARWVPQGMEKEATPTEITPLSPPQWAAKVARGSSGHSSQDPSTSSSTSRSSHWLRRSTPRDETTLPRPRDPSPSPPTDPTMTKRPVVQMSYTVMLDLDSQKRSEQAERVVCHFDRSHNPLAAYHIELTWLAASGKIIDTAIQNWTRQMARFGLGLIEVSTRSVFSGHNPFQKANRVRLALPPPTLLTRKDQLPLPQHYYEAELLRSLHFFLDIGSDETFPPSLQAQYSYRRSSSSHSQYIHQNGTLLVSILGGEEGFAWVPNRIFISHSSTRPDEVVRALQELCGDEERLKVLWEEIEARSNE